MAESTLESVRESIPDGAKDLKLNLQAVLGEGSLTPAQRWGTALAVATAVKCAPLRQALLKETVAQAGEAVAEDAQAAAALMGMNNVYYRFRHLVGREEYGQLPARLRMNRLGKPASDKVDMELFALAVSAVNACEACVQAHERTLRDAGLTEAQINDAVRIAATVAGAAVALQAQDT
jgi:alkyl hydroperoxide reductase subunit D